MNEYPIYPRTINKIVFFIADTAAFCENIFLNPLIGFNFENLGFIASLLNKNPVCATFYITPSIIITTPIGINILA